MAFQLNFGGIVDPWTILIIIVLVVGELATHAGPKGACKNKCEV